MTEQRFKYRFDKRTMRLSFMTACLVAIALAALVMLVGDSYLRAWLVSILVAIVLLYVLSIPRYVKINGEALEIHCMIEMTRIPIEDLSSIRKVTRQDLGRVYLLLGSYGFFGYYGYYLSLKRWETIKVYASERNNLVEIEDIYEQRYVVSCREADRLIELVMQAKLEHAGEETDDPHEE